jgi:hypothetical protein
MKPKIGRPLKGASSTAKYTKSQTKIRKYLRSITPNKTVTPKSFVKSQYTEHGRTPKRVKWMIGKQAEKLKVPKTEMYKAAGVHSFQGKYGGDGKQYAEGTPGLFTQSIKGMRGKFFIEKALDKTMGEMKSYD